MADRRTDESSAPSPATGSSAGAAAGSTGPDRLTDRINEAYAASGPVLPDEPGQPAKEGKPSGAERFAAVLAATGSKTKEAAGSRPTKPTKPTRSPRRARLRLTHIDPWSVLKTAFLLSVALGIVTVVSVTIVWSVLDAAGVWSSIDSTVGDVVGESGSTFRIEDYVGLSRVLGFTLIVAVVDVVLVTVIATLAAFLYNLAAALLGGIEVVLAEEDR